ncbi:Prolyl tripeptidyl peptidase [termite gut metagenome]|uniref:Prolyl tripeptidyl peptidase n=1 Tax=termite gut metagenome TaxID=433724 RepID=A0A5J4SRV9_9ZZZZ
MKRIFKTLLIVVFQLPFFTLNIMAQELKTPTLDELISGGANYRFPDNLYGLQWWGNECIRTDIDELYVINPRSGKEQVLFTREQLNKVLEGKQLGTVPHLHNLCFYWQNKSEVLVPLPNKYVIYDFKTGRVVKVLPILSKALNTDFCPESGHVTFTVDNNLYVDNVSVTQEPEGIVCGQSVHRNEFGINKGTFWSPKGNLLAFYRMDETMVTQYPLVDITERTGKVDNIRYPMAGMTSHKVGIGIYNPDDNKTIYLNTGDPTDRYFTNISWSPDEESLYLIELNRDQNHAKLCRYDAKTGEPDTILIEETHPKYIEPQNPIVFLPWNDKLFIYQSQRDGFNHLYIYDTDGNFVKQLTSGHWLVKKTVGFNTKRKEVFIISTELSPLQSNLFKVNVQTEKRVLLGTTDGTHQGQPNPSGDYLIDRYASPNIPRSINIIDTSTNRKVNLLTAKDPFEGYKKPTVEVGIIKADDEKTNLYYRLIVPPDFDPNKKYPAIVYVYGGTHNQMVVNTWQYGARPWDIYMADRGYVMFTLDNRGSSNRGLEFENCTFRHLGVEECKDQIKGVEFLKSLSFVNSSRIGVHGWSYGGHITTALMLRYPDAFKAGVAGGPVIDWKYYEVMYGERYMDTPQTNPEGYEECNLNNYAGNLKRKLLIIHNDHDDTCVPQHTMSFIKACVDAGTYPDLFIYPGHKHNVVGKDRIHLYEKITKYLEEELEF